MRRYLLPLALLFVSAFPFAASRADDFYRGKQITILVGFSAGGTYDATARLFARHLGRHLAGNPTVIVQNMPGAGSMVATMNLFHTAPKDGTTLGVIGGGTVIEPLLGNPQAKYDARQFAWIGGRSRDDFLCVVWHTVPVNSIADATTRQVVVGATGPGSRTQTYPQALNDLAGTKFKIVSGYPGGNEITLALQKGEVEGYCGWAVGSIRQRAPQWLTDGTLKVLVQFTAGKPDLPNAPVATDLAKTKEGREAIQILSADSVLAWPLMAPPGLPADRVRELRTAFDAMMADPALLADAKKANLDVDRVSGAEMQALIDRLYAAPAPVLDLVRKINMGN
ncbi:MAG TPA: tripartite tricarboxylate transporter substrate-binding protein [Xanthobacteraceae bacterium]|nr:tripartite tricarboxylate transporter substrate-binding protein [Xanthobacteraceae bacterium]